MKQARRKREKENTVKRNNQQRGHIARWLVEKPFLYICALFVVAAVVWSTMTPAVTDSGGVDEGGITYPYEGVPDNAYLFKPDIVDVSATQQDEGPDGEGQISVDFNLAYTITKATLENGNYIYYNLNSDRVDESGATIVIPEGGLPAGNFLGDVMLADQKVGTYRIEDDGTIIIRFTDEFREEVLSSTAEEGRRAVIHFSADVKGSDDNTSDDIELDFGGNDSADSTVEITGFLYSNVSIEKQVSSTLNENGKLAWSLTVSNPDCANLEGLIISDTMFKEAENISCSAPGDVSETDDGEKVFILGSTTAETVTITYTTDPGNDYNLILNGGWVNNEAVIKNQNNRELDEANTGTNQPSMISGEKSGSVEYGSDTDTITWTITIDNPYGLDLNGYYVEDSGFASSIQITDGENVIPTEKYTFENNKLTFKEAVTYEKIVITYTSVVDKATATNEDYKNEARLYAPNGNDNKYMSEEVLRQAISVDKNGYSVNGNNQINWTITIEDRIEDETSFADLLITDDVLFSIINGQNMTDEQIKAQFNFVDGTNSAMSIPYDVVRDSNGNVIGIQVDENFDPATLGKDWQGYVKISLSYSTDADLGSEYTEQITNGVSTTNKISASANDGAIDVSDEATVTYQYRKNINKAYGTPELSEDGKTLTIPWTVVVEGEFGYFENIQLIDTMSATVNDRTVTHSFSEITQISVQYLNSTTNTVTEMQLNNEQYSVAVDEDGKVTIKLNEAVLGEDIVSKINKMTVEYKTVVTLDDTITLAEDDIIHFSNKAEIPTLDINTENGGDFTYIAEENRINKISLDKDGDGIIDLGGVPTATIEIDGEPTVCYLFKWQVTLNENDGYDASTGELTLTDTLPEGFYLLENGAGANRVYIDIHYDGGNKEECILSATQSASSWAGYYSLETTANDGQIVKFHINEYAYASGRMSYLYYTTYAPKDVLDAKISEAESTGTGYSIVNEISDGTYSKSETVEPRPAELPESDGMITKEPQTQTTGGYISYTVDFNPDSLDLLPGSDYVLLKDEFNFGSYYYDKDGHLIDSDPSELLNVTLQRIDFFEVDENGDKTPLAPQPVYSFKDKPTEEIVSDVEGEYLENENSLWTAYENDYVFRGIPDGAVLTVIVQFDNSPIIDAESVYRRDTYNNTSLSYNRTQIGETTYQYTIAVTAQDGSETTDVYVCLGNMSSMGGIAGDFTAEAKVTNKTSDAELTFTLPDGKHIQIEYTYRALSDEVYSVPVSNSVTSVSKYGTHFDDSSVQFEAHNDSEAVVHTYLGIEKTDSSDSSLKLNAGFILARYNTNTWQWEYAQSVTGFIIDSWDTNKPEEELFSTDGSGVYYLDPDPGYLYYLKEVRTPEGYDPNFSDNKYFVYNTSVSNLNIPQTGPDGDLIIASSIINLVTDSTLTVVNRKTDISISATKTWADGNNKHADDTVKFELWFSTTRSNSATDIPQDAEIYSSAVEVNAICNWSYTWENLRSADDSGRPLYYYVKEVEVEEGYTPSYVNNGLNNNGTIQVTNSRGLTLTKEWFNADGSTPIADAELGDITEIQLNLYRSTALSSTIPTEKELVGAYTLRKSENWTLDIPSLAAGDGEGHTYYYYVEEVSVGGYTTSYRINGSEYNGLLVVRNIKDSSYQLPSTGGPGTSRYLFGGVMLLMTAAIGYIAVQVICRKGNTAFAGTNKKEKEKKL